MLKNRKDPAAARAASMSARSASTLTMPDSLLARRAKAALDRSEFAASEHLCRMILERSPTDRDALGLLGIVAVKTRRLDLAMDLLPKAVAANPRDPAVHTHLGVALLLLDRAAEALLSVDRALALAPDDPFVLNVRACVLGNLARFEESIACCDRALAVRPDYVAALVNRGNACVRLGRHEEALASFEDALWTEPDSVEALNNCASILKTLGRHEQALRRYERALEFRPDYVEAAYNSAVTLAELGRPREAVKRYLRALSIQPRHLLARYNLSLCRLLLGDFARAWDDHDAWIERAALDGRHRSFPKPRWRGEANIDGRTVLLHADEGLGDTIQFSRYARDVAALGARVVLEVQRPLVKVMTGLDGVCKVVPRGARLPKFDLHCPLMSLPAALRTTVSTIPEHGPYVRSDERLVARWHRRLNRGGTRLGPRIGLAWSGNPAHVNDTHRSIPLEALLPLLQFDADWVSLQKDVRGSDAALLGSDKRVRDFAPLIRDFTDTAALVTQMDLVIAVDTSIAHLAGAMGKPVWILLPFHPDWRWLLRRTDSPWYPSARLFRQRAIGDWAGVVRRVRRALVSVRTET